MRSIDGDMLKEEIDYYIREAGWDEAHNEALRWCLEFIDNQTTINTDISQDGTLTVTVDDVDSVKRVMVQSGQWCKVMYPETDAIQKLTEGE